LRNSWVISFSITFNYFIIKKFIRNIKIGNWDIAAKLSFVNNISRVRRLETSWKGCSFILHFKESFCCKSNFNIPFKFDYDYNLRLHKIICNHYITCKSSRLSHSQMGNEILKRYKLIYHVASSFALQLKSLITSIELMSLSYRGVNTNFFVFTNEIF